eukprot:3815894-Alexandrium_andersonii.AAC.1
MDASRLLLCAVRKYRLPSFSRSSRCWASGTGRGRVVMNCTPGPKQYQSPCRVPSPTLWIT